MNWHPVSLRGGQTYFVMVFHTLLRQILNYCFSAISSHELCVWYLLRFFQLCNNLDTVEKNTIGDGGSTALNCWHCWHCWHCWRCWHCLHCLHYWHCWHGVPCRHGLHCWHVDMGVWRGWGRGLTGLRGLTRLMWLLFVLSYLKFKIFKRKCSRVGSHGSGQVDRFTAGESEDRPRVNLLLSHYLR